MKNTVTITLTTYEVPAVLRALVAAYLDEDTEPEDKEPLRWVYNRLKTMIGEDVDNG